MNKLKIKPVIFFLLFLILVSIVFIVYALSFARFQAALVPICAASLIILLAIIELASELKSGQTEEGGVEAAEDGEKTEPGVFVRRVGLLAAWVAGLTAGIYYLGFLIANPIFLFAFLKSRGTGWLGSFLVAAVVSGALYGFFELILERRLWRGQLFW